jgi:hypothetical protein
METERDRDARLKERRQRIKRMVYKQRPSAATEGEVTELHIPLMEGHAFHPGSTHMCHMGRAAQDVVSTILNAKAHMEGIKKSKCKMVLDTTKDMPVFNVPMRLEVIPSAPDPVTRKQYCVGVKLKLFATPTQRGLAQLTLGPVPQEGEGEEEEEEDEPSLLAASALEEEDESDNTEEAPAAAAAAAENEPPEPRQPRRARGGAAAAAAAVATAKKKKKAAEAQRKRNAAMRAPTKAQMRASAEQSPFAYGLLASYHEAQDIQQKFADVRNRQNNNRTQAMPVRNPEELIQFRYAKFDKPESFHFDGVKQFFGQADEVATVTDPFPAFLYVEEVSHKKYLVPRSDAMSPETIFSKERGFYYHMNSPSLPVDKPHRLISNYVPGSAVALADLPEERGGEEEVEVEGPDGQPLPSMRGVPDLAKLLDPKSGAPRFPDNPNPMAPRPALEFLVHPKVTLAEILLRYIPLPYAIGEEIPDNAFNAETTTPVFTELPVAEEAELLDAIERLRIVEEEAAHQAEGDNPQGNGRRLPKSPDQVQVRGTKDNWGQKLGDALEDANRMERIQGKPADKLNGSRALSAAAAVPTQLTSKQLDTRRRQDLVIDRCIGDMHNKLIRCQYEELMPMSAAVREAAREESTHLIMTPDDFYGKSQGVSSSSAIAGSTLGAVRRLTGAVDDIITNMVANIQTNVPVDAMGAPVQPVFNKEETRQRIMEKVEVFPDWTIRRSAFIDMRQKKQMSKAGMIDRHKVELNTFKSTPPPRGKRKQWQSMIRDMELRHREETRIWRLDALRDFHKVFSTTDLASRAWREVRDYIKTHIWPNRKISQNNTVRSGLNARGMVQYWQHELDSAINIDEVSAQNLPYLLRARICGFNAHRWMARRSEPALNYTIVGPSGAGKSFVLRRVEFLSPPGVAQNMTNSTTSAFNVDEDFDNNMYIQEEMDSAFLFSNTGGKDLGATDKINYLKARTTSFCTVTMYFHHNEETGERQAKHCYSSQHVVMLSATNQKLEKMDVNMGRRLLIDYVMERVAITDGGRAADMQHLSLLEKSAKGQRMQREHRELHSALMYVETAIKAHAMEEVSDSGAMIMLGNILASASKRVPQEKTTKNHWIIEAARIMTILNACHWALFSAEAHKIYAEGKIERWSPEMFYYLVDPHLVITKDALILALTQFDFLYASRDEDLLLKTIAERVCHASTPSRWQLRKLPASDRLDPEIDYNYICYKSSYYKIADTIAESHKDIAQPRSEDVLAMLKPYEKVIITSKGYDKRVDGFGVVAAGDSVPEKSRQAMFFENDPMAAASNKSARQYCISLDFLANRFGIDFVNDGVDKIRAILSPPEKHINGQNFSNKRFHATDDDLAQGMIIAREMTECTDDRAPLVHSIRTVLGNPTLELHPYEDAKLLPNPPEVYKYMTFYTPDDVHVHHTDGESSVRVALHGAPMLLEMRRDPNQPLLRRDNFNRPMPTARVSVYNGTPDDAPEADMSYGYVIRDADVDFITFFKRMETSCHPGIPFMEAHFVRQCLVDAHCQVDPKIPCEKRDALFTALPDLEDIYKNAPGRVPLPFFFPPILYRIQKSSRLEDKEVMIANYPACNVFDRIQNVVMRHKSVHDKTLFAYRDLGETLGVTRSFRKTRRIATEEDDDDDDGNVQAPIISLEELDAMDIDGVPARARTGPQLGKRRRGDADEEEEERPKKRSRLVVEEEEEEEVPAVDEAPRKRRRRSPRVSEDEHSEHSNEAYHSYEADGSLEDTRPRKKTRADLLKKV